MCVSEGDVTVYSELEPLTLDPPPPHGYGAYQRMAVRETKGQLGKQRENIIFPLREAI